MWIAQQYYWGETGETVFVATHLYIYLNFLWQNRWDNLSQTRTKVKKIGMNEFNTNNISRFKLYSIYNDKSHSMNKLFGIVSWVVKSDFFFAFLNLELIDLSLSWFEPWTLALDSILESEYKYKYLWRPKLILIPDLLFHHRKQLKVFVLLNLLEKKDFTPQRFHFYEQKKNLRT